MQGMLRLTEKCGCCAQRGNNTGLSLSLVYCRTGVTFHDSLVNTQLRAKLVFAYI